MVAELPEKVNHCDGNNSIGGQFSLGLVGGGNGWSEAGRGRAGPRSGKRTSNTRWSSTIFSPPTRTCPKQSVKSIPDSARVCVDNVELQIAFRIRHNQRMMDRPDDMSDLRQGPSSDDVQ